MAVDTIETTTPRPVAQTGFSLLRPGAGEARPVAFSWCAEPDAAIAPIAMSMLDPAERARAGRFANAAARGAFLRGRLCAKTALAVLDSHRRRPKDFAIMGGAFGQPVVSPASCGLDVAISHTGTAAAAVAFPTGWPLALDLERIDAANAVAIRGQIAPDEEAAVAALGLSEDAALAVLWAAREALSKALRGGLSISFPAMRVCNVAGDRARLRCGFADFAHYRAEVAVGRNAVLALVLPADHSLDWSAPAGWVAGLAP